MCVCVCASTSQQFQDVHQNTKRGEQGKHTVHAQELHTDTKRNPLRTRERGGGGGRGTPGTRTKKKEGGVTSTLGDRQITGQETIPGGTQCTHIQIHFREEGGHARLGMHIRCDYHWKSFTIRAFSRMYLPSLYFWLCSKACSYFHPSTVSQELQ